ncbi:MAG: response regulator [Lachnospiraceae bacterium]|nr:response regulator [Lachnospiraceae bacterium]
MSEESIGKKILFIGDLSSFLGNAIKSNLTDAGYEIIFAKAKADDISAHKKEANIIMMHLIEDMEKLNEALVYLKDLIIEDEKLFFLIGYESEIEDAKKVIPISMITGTFDRPLNVKKLVEGLNEKVSSVENAPRKKHILVVDDSGTFLRTIKSWLEPYYKVSMVNSGMNAITFLAKTKPDLILLDYEMPVCSGPQVLGMIRDEVSTSSLPVMFLTAKGDKESVMSVVSLKPEGYILKTMEPDEIRKVISEFFEHQKYKEASNI